MKSCLDKLLERIIYTIMYNFLERNSCVIHEESRFRKQRNTDNLQFLIQRVIKRKRYAVCIMYIVIFKAFDIILHDGLIYKLISLNLPPYLLL